MKELIIKITKDGNQISALLGENIQEGNAGFGSTLSDALMELATDLTASGQDLNVNDIEGVETSANESFNGPKCRWYSAWTVGQDWPECHNSNRPTHHKGKWGPCHRDCKGASKAAYDKVESDKKAEKMRAFKILEEEFIRNMHP